MRKPLVLCAVGCGLLAVGFGAVQEGNTPTVATMPPVVVKTVPAAGAVDVDPELDEIRVTFSKKMTKGSFSWSTAWKDSTPDFISAPRYDKDDRTCIARVKLEPGRTYGFWLNSDRFGNFKDEDGRKAVPYLLVFETKPDKKRGKR